MALLTPVTSLITGAVLGGVDGALAAATATTGDTFANDGTQLLIIFNKSASPTTLTITTPALAADGLAIADPTKVIAANTAQVFGPFRPSTYNDAANIVTVVLSAVTTVTLGVVKLTPL